MVWLASQERSLTTILYLMSMTECARAPFSLVDEINQVRDTGWCVTRNVNGMHV
jgi:hypothetical protein